MTLWSLNKSIMQIEWSCYEEGKSFTLICMSSLNSLDGLGASGPGGAGPWNVSIPQPWWLLWALDQHGEGS